MQGPQELEGVADVGDDELPIGVLDGAVRRQLRELLVVGLLALDRLGEDRGVGSHAPDAVRDHLPEPPVPDPIPPQVVEPGALALRLVQLVQSAHDDLLWLRSLSAWATTLSTVNPRWRNASVPGADAPKRSKVTVASA